ncbi:MAG: 30S ribosomal protein S20 [Proteobacteria bacterium]|nr:30S ribosomal protein S20 [Pseudomonadota bacterium]
MANTKSAKKSIKVNERRRVRNQAARSAVKTAVKRTVDAVKKNVEEGKTIANAAFSVIDKAAVKGIIHKNTAARKKSRLARKLNKAAANA